MTPTDEFARTLIARLAATLPTFLDGRVDYTDATEAAALNCIVRYEEELLLLKRSDAVAAMRGKWHTVAGFLDRVVTPDVMARTEMLEEAGIHEQDISRMVSMPPITVRNGDNNKTWHIFPVIAHLKHKPTVTLNWEHTDYAWVRPDQLKDFDTAFNLDEILGLVWNT